MGDGVFMTRFLAFLMVAWPAIVTLLVYMARRSRITRVARYFVASLLSGYALSLLVPLGIVFAGMLLGAVAEVATFFAIVFSIPLLLVLQTGVAVFWSGRFVGVAQPPA